MITVKREEGQRPPTPWWVQLVALGMVCGTIVACGFGWLYH